MVLIINCFHIKIILWGLHPVVIVVVVEVIVVVDVIVAEFIDVEIVEVAVVVVVIIAAMVVSYTGVFSLVVVSLVELQACIVVTVETIRIKILTIVFPLLDFIILPDALVTNTLHKSIIIYKYVLWAQLTFVYAIKS